MHAKNFSSVSEVAGRHVVVVGAGKTAADCMAEVASSKTASSVTWLYRQPHWPVPRFILGIPIRNIIFSRLIPGSTLPPYYTNHNRLGAIKRPFQRAFWWSVEKIINKMFHLDSDQGQRRPSMKLPQDIFFGGQVQSCMKLCAIVSFINKHCLICRYLSIP